MATQPTGAVPPAIPPRYAAFVKEGKLYLGNKELHVKYGNITRTDVSELELRKIASLLNKHFDTEKLYLELFSKPGGKLALTKESIQNQTFAKTEGKFRRDETVAAHYERKLADLEEIRKAKPTEGKAAWTRGVIGGRNLEIGPARAPAEPRQLRKGFSDTFSSWKTKTIGEKGAILEELAETVLSDDEIKTVKEKYSDDLTTSQRERLDRQLKLREELQKLDDPNSSRETKQGILAGLLKIDLYPAEVMHIRERHVDLLKDKQDIDKKFLEKYTSALGSHSTFELRLLGQTKPQRLERVHQPVEEDETAEETEGAEHVAASDDEEVSQVSRIEDILTARAEQAEDAQAEKEDKVVQARGRIGGIFSRALSFVRGTQTSR